MRSIRLVLAGLAGVAAAIAVSGIALGGSTPTLAVMQNVKNVRHGNTPETVAVNSRGLAVYFLSGDRPKHPLCTKANGCFGVWKPVKAPSGKLTKAHGISGKLGRLQRGKLSQLTLGHHPLYTFDSDTKGVAGGDTIMSFGGTWHVVRASGGSPGKTTTSTPSTTGTTSPCLYPPCY